jgi:hypothetical protein
MASRGISHQSWLIEFDILLKMTQALGLERLPAGSSRISNHDSTWSSDRPQGLSSSLRRN